MRFLARVGADADGALDLLCNSIIRPIALAFRTAGLRLNIRLAVLLLLVGGDAAIRDANDAVRIRGDVTVVGHHNDGVAFSVQSYENGHDFLAALAI